MIRRRAARATALTLALAAPLAAGACGTADAPPAPGAVEGSAYMPEPVTGKMAAGYFTLTNDGDEPDTLTAVTSDVSDDVQFHRTVDNRMERVESFGIPAHGELALSRGGNHLMFMGLERKPSKGDTVRLELHFEKSEPLTLEVPVEATNHQPSAAAGQR
ncbi:copper chaperone PCu(A)C [Streptomyces sp. TRM 70351]|uniref:copper chaperone PCu(A)C n=1 Tax=Streptomyces sp. TRM 70351 TaxID=3116552 RepID=UPI002E7AD30C|nr:copper chaperone PCu(A)C [Streptomyces sp. TRM 70351]MEE1929947.1 copper chaperone PCu(A)C [Streptomyces sp. TRM 70351]